MSESDLTAAELRLLLDYDPSTGVFTHRRNIGKRCGNFAPDGRMRIFVAGRSYKAHRLAWLYVHGCWPTGCVDHINRNPADNRIANLRDVSKAENTQNVVAARQNNRVGLLGVRKAWRRFAARIKVAGREIHLGYFDTPEEAHAAYLEAKRDLHPGFAA